MTTPNLGLKQPAFRAVDSDGTGWTHDLNDNWGVIDTVLGSAFLNVKQYGAVGNGSADDTAAIQAAFDAAPQAPSYGRGATVLFPPGKYKTGQLTLKQGVSLVGVGAPLAYDDRYSAALIPNANDIILLNRSGGSLQQGGVEIRNMVFSTGSYTGCTGIKVVDLNRLNLYNCGFEHLAVGLDVETAGLDSAWHNFYSCWFHHCLIGAKHVGNGVNIFGGDFIQNAAGDTGLLLYADSTYGCQTVNVFGTKFAGGIGIDARAGFSKFVALTFEVCAMGITVSHPAGSASYVGTRNAILSPTFSVCTTDIQVADSSCTDNAIIGYATTSPTNGIVDSGVRTTVLSNVGARMAGAVFPGAVATKTKTSAPADADWTIAPPNGTMVVDTTVSPKRLYIRVGTNDWDYVALT